jgi:3-phenylpropionate/trans-cinnamate dioxygenase ferredoxin reductase subunit
VVLIGAEPVGPYHRPPLSKSLLKGEFEQPLLPKDFYREQRIELRIGTRVVSIDRDGRFVRLADGETVPYDVVILATGAKARRLPVPGVDLEKVYELRTLTEARVLHDVLSPGRRLAIVGGGWIGLEVAASARSAGIDVTVIGREERLLARVASEGLSQFMTDYHLREGTKLYTSARVTALEPMRGRRVGSVVLDDGRTIPCDRVLIGVGSVVDDELARAAGLPCDDGVIVDEHARTEDPRIYAVGDVTLRPLAFHDGLFRLHSIPSAVEQARQAVASILGKPAPKPEVPWFWSDQFDLKLQIAGLLLDTDAVTVREDRSSTKQAIFHTRDDRLVAVEAINATQEFMAGKRMIREEFQLDLSRLADPSVPLDEVVAGAPVPARSAAPQSAASAGTAAAAVLDRQDLPGAGGKPGEPRAIFILPTGDVSPLAVPAGLTLMEASVRNNLPGIIAECGGQCACGTCHVYVDEEWQTRLQEPTSEEVDMLEFTDDREDASRLSCQIVMTDDLDGLTVRVPPSAV